MLAPEQTRPAVRSYLAAARNFQSGSETPRRFLDESLALLERWEPRIGAFVCTNLAAARTAAERSTERWRAGRPLSPIDGMPIGIKDIFETVDMPTEMGSPLFAGWRSGKDAASVRALRDAGAVILGKTVTTEFAASEPRGTRNPWNVAHTPGGSSSGSAAAVATGIVSTALGTQVIGSTIRPASYCGCVGFKPSVNALNRQGSHDYQSQSCTGILAASLPDAWQVAYEIVARVGGDAGTPGLQGPDRAPAANKPRRLAVLETAGWEGASAEAGIRVVLRIPSDAKEIATALRFLIVQPLQHLLVGDSICLGECCATEVDRRHHVGLRRPLSFVASEEPQHILEHRAAQGAPVLLVGVWQIRMRHKVLGDE